MRIGTVGMIKPTRVAPGLLDELVPLLPPGVGLMPVYLDVVRGAVAEFAAAMPAYEKNVAFLAEQGCDLIHAEGAPPFMVQGAVRERELIGEWAARYHTPIFTSAQNHVNALRTLGITRLVGATYLGPELNALFTTYFTDCGFTVLSMDGFDVPFDKVAAVPSAEIAAFIERNVRRHAGSDGVYMLGSGWRTLDIIEQLEQRLGLPVVHPVAARAWEIQKRLKVRQPVTGHGRLLAELP